MSLYDAQQTQRRMERQIRQDKKDVAGLQGALTSNNKDLNIEKIQEELQDVKTKMKLHNSILNNFLDETGFRKDYSRLQI